MNDRKTRFFSGGSVVNNKKFFASHQEVLNVDADFKKKIVKWFDILLSLSPGSSGSREAPIHRCVWTDEGAFHYFFLFRREEKLRDRYDTLILFYNPWASGQPLDIVYRDEQDRDLGNSPFFPEYLRAIQVMLEHPVKKETHDPVTGEAGLAPRRKAITDFYKKVEKDRRCFETYRAADPSGVFSIREELSFPVADEPPAPAIIALLEKLREKRRTDEAAKAKPTARLALRLVFLEKFARLALQPVMIQVFKDGSEGESKSLTAAMLDKKSWNMEIPSEVQTYVQYMDEQKKWGPVKQEQRFIQDLLFFHPLARLAFRMPRISLFYESEGGEGRHPVQTVVFHHVRFFYTGVTGSSHYRLVLLLTDRNGRKILVGRNYQAAVTPEGGVFLFSAGEGGEDPMIFARPRRAEEFIEIFRLIGEIRHVSPGSLALATRELKTFASPAITVDPAPVPRCFVRFRPIPVLKIFTMGTPHAPIEAISLAFDYRTGLSRFMKMNPDKLSPAAERAEDYETYCLRLLGADSFLMFMDDYKETLGIKVADAHVFLLVLDANEWLKNRSEFYRNKGFRVLRNVGEEGLVGAQFARLRIETREEENWVEFRPMLESLSGGDFPGEALPMANLKDFKPGERDWAYDTEGNACMLSPEDVETLREFYLWTEMNDNGFRTPAGNYFLLSRLARPEMKDIPVIARALEFSGRLKEFERIPDYQLSEAFNGRLRSYQTAGFHWLMFLHDYDLFGCLADDMGLGKTVQTLALLQTLKSLGKLETSLLVVPVSAIPNWELEIARFAPGLTVCRQLGAGRKADAEEWKKYDLIVTSYATLRSDIHVLADFPFYYIILDESQNIKNAGSQTSRAVKSLNSRKRLALSGTPVENSTLELWSLMDFLAPGYLGSREWFHSQWAMPVEKNNDEMRRRELRRMIHPFLLRRRKEDVEKELPVKTEIVETLAMGDEQCQVYSEVASRYGRRIASTISEKGVGGSAFTILEALMRLRQVCLFPFLADSAFKTVKSVKFDHFRRMVKDIVGEGHKVLVFSQFTGVLDILEEYLRGGEVGYVRLDGATPAAKRGGLIREFQENPRTGVFLLSLKAGGTALNLTAADYVIIFDPWWNPAVEAQAMDRAHRIGQQRKVFVYRYIVRGTIEEKMLKLQARKKDLADQVIIPDETFLKNFSREDILELFQFGE